MIVCNTRALGAPLSGVQRYTIELLKHWPGSIRVVKPPELLSGPAGQLWEQMMLPLQARGDLLWSPVNTGPIGYANQVVTVHDIAPLDWPDGYSPAFRRWYRYLWKRLLPRVRALITVSDFTKQRLIAEFGLSAGTIHVTHLGVDHQRFFQRSADEIEEVRRKFELPDNYVLFVGGVSGRKNMRRLLRAWQRLAMSDLHLLIAGAVAPDRVLTGTELPELPANTRVLGHVDDDDLPKLLTGARAFVYPSLYEGFGLPPLEAMACGVPCLASNVTSVPEVTSDAALLVDPTDESALAEGLVQIASNEGLRSRLRMRGLQRAQEFTWQKTAAATKAVLLQHAN
jgi:glycosyltransferase involved in cell wall biosynthesis